MIYVVLGMHKSGTTLVSRLLHHSGISMGPGFDAAVDYEKGNTYEDSAASALNRALLGITDTRSIEIGIPDPLQADPIAQEKLRRFIASRQTAHSHWGFKDPRSTLTYPVWRGLLPPHRVVGIFRPPEEVWPRYRRGGLKGPWLDIAIARQFLRSWCEHNERLIGIVRANPAAILLDYRALMSGSAEYERLERFLCVPLSDQRKAVASESKPSWHLTLARPFARSTSGRPASAILRELGAIRGSQLTNPEPPE